jgi:tetratricopeptide (TPR) repeat protein
MTPEGPESETLEMAEEFSRWLAACDERLADGSETVSLDELGVPAVLRERLEREAAWCQLVRRIWPPAAGPAPGPTDEGPPSSGPPPRRLGRFEVRRELGRGAFGVVSLAYDSHLRREVALKVPRAEVVVTPDLRARFRHEAMAAAGLDHPNIVPVYEAGEEDSVCFIASAYCPGMTLAAWLRRRTTPVPYRQAAELVATLAEAVEHAHRRGVLHRDLKPSNVLLDELPAGASAGDGPSVTPRVTDFGLAKLLDARPGEDGAASPTLSGVIMGTPNYMAPEQADGRAGTVGPAADIYSLGVILYEVLTGRPPFQEDSALETLVQVRTQDALPPSRLRPRLPRDLETICLKCLNKSPQARYPDAQALADDLRRFLAAEPILARPTPRWERALKWMRRHPAIAAMTGSVAVAAVALAVAIGLANIRLQHERDLAEARRREAVANLRKAREAVDRMLTRVSEERLKDIPQVEPIQRALLEDALEFYRDFARQARDDPEVLLETSLAFGRLGGCYGRLGRSQESEGCHLEALAIQQKLAAAYPTVAAYRTALARTDLELAKFRRNDDRPAEGAEFLRRALGLLEGLTSADPGEPAYRDIQADAFNVQGMLFEDLGQIPAAEAAYDRATAQFQDLIDRFPTVGRYRSRLAVVGNNLAAMLLVNDRRLDEAETIYRHNLEYWKGMAASEPAIPDHRSKLALTYDNLAGVLAKTGRKPEAEQALRSAIDLRSALTKYFSSSPHHFEKLAGALNGLAGLVADRGDLGEVRRLNEQAIASNRAALALAPGNAFYRRGLAGAHAHLVETLIRSGEHAEAAKTVAEYLATVPDSPPDRFRAGAFLARCVPMAAAGERLDATRRADLARGYADRAVELLRESLKAGYPDVEALKSDHAFDALRSRDDFRRLLNGSVTPSASPRP